jgi:DNA-binding response OmpR family regulator
MVQLLLVDDDPNIRELIALHLRMEGFDLLESANGHEAMQMIDKHRVDLLILDIMMPEMDGWDVCRYLRAKSDIPILMVTAQGEIAHKMKGFRLGTDDYLVKPFDPFELVMRVKALLKRYRIASSQMIQLGKVHLDQKRLEVTINDQHISLPPKEFELLFKLASYPGQIFSREQCIEQIWGFDYEGDDRTVDVHIKRLRERFNELTDDFRISTIRGLGYRLEVNE